MHTMTCPGCGGQLVELERSGVVIDACRSCRGVWLDRGELDKIIAREGDHRGRDDDDDDDDDDRRPRDGSGRRKKSRRGFLSEMFEFGD
jgi:Zn-finger nucleic acid-binding protein